MPALQALHTPEQAARWLAARVTGALQCDSRRVRPGDAFIAWPGAATDGRRHVPAALAAGAVGCLVEAEGVDAYTFAWDAPIATYAGLKAATGPIADAYYAHPSHEIDVLAVTGTNGKTSTTWWLAQALSAADPRGCAVIGTLGVGRPPQVAFTGLTTPDPVLMHTWFRRFADQGLAACAIEASSIGIAERRLDGTRIRVAIFTNFTRDHLDYHGTMDAYWQAKAELFAWHGVRAAVVNVDDERGGQLVRELQGSDVDLWTYSARAQAQVPARLQARDVEPADEGLRFTVVEGDDRVALRTTLIGEFNVANLLAVIGGLRAMGVTLPDSVAVCTNLLPVPGRMERFQEPGQPLVAVDYAHTPDALDQALAALRPLAQRRGGRLWCVFGCGGDRDRSKRPLMGAVAHRQADRVVVTSDNPRSEDPQAIIDQIVAGIAQGESVMTEPDRTHAIALAVGGAAPADVILLAGKGHEDYQEVAGVRLPFDDRVQARAALAQRAKKATA